MRRLVLPALLALLGLLAVPAAAERTDPVQPGLQERTQTGPNDTKRRGLLYVPQAVADKPHKKVPLLVYLHGCNQDALDVAYGTRLMRLADEKSLLVLFPEQRNSAPTTYPHADGNGTSCWNWFVPDHQKRGAGEPGLLADMTRAVAEEFAVDDRSVWVAGASAGANMATILAVAYPDLFRAVAPISGCAFLTCGDVTGRLAHDAMSVKRVVPTLVVQGTADMVNNAAMGATALAQWLGTNDLADDGAANGSVPRVPTGRQDHPAVQGDQPGDPCIGNRRLPCLGGLLGLKTYAHTVLEYGPSVSALVIHGANHAYTGGDPTPIPGTTPAKQPTFVDPVGPDLAHAMYDFFASRTSAKHQAAS